ncbi:MAG: ribonuclease III [Clostridiales bacterium]|nr:ribonuclease III [Clostridiales bacterium]
MQNKNIPVHQNPIETKDALGMNALVLAFIGDAFLTLFVRTDLATASSRKAGELHKRTSAVINARNQARIADAVFPLLDDAEREVYMRGRNAKSKNTAKNADVFVYKKATALEAVLGFLYVTGRTDRIEELMKPY